MLASAAGIVSPDAGPSSGGMAAPTEHCPACAPLARDLGGSSRAGLSHAPPDKPWLSMPCPDTLLAPPPTSARKEASRSRRGSTHVSAAAGCAASPGCAGLSGRRGASRATSAAAAVPGAASAAGASAQPPTPPPPRWRAGLRPGWVWPGGAASGDPRGASRPGFGSPPECTAGTPDTHAPATSPPSTTHPPSRPSAAAAAPPAHASATTPAHLAASDAPMDHALTPASRAPPLAPAAAAAPGGAGAAGSGTPSLSSGSSAGAPSSGAGSPIHRRPWSRAPVAASLGVAVAGGSGAEGGAASGALCREHSARRQRRSPRCDQPVGRGSRVHWLAGAWQ